MSSSFQGPHTRIVVALRKFLVGRDLVLAHRTTNEAATRSPPLPQLPQGPAHCLHSNHYFTRDLRRDAFPPLNIMESSKQLATDGTTEWENMKPVLTAAVPGKRYHWTHSQ
ncbi:NADH dehydrogenase [ubiquinone] 1 alpha subcomplex subunit 7-like [Corticium candelabrum]|uniref:NADH dehydrogenase [ubiquinone] 1 alpha subcomplex subunit 7-like n=1 Tax=Corticium candelabrum TaxID=121492 RepID=UPI002E25E1A8|nr:NADH dehydrogenase [ubiquinone] 1 alpha subcomplex subunit 7-like [Corticium candelabrum]